MSRFFCFIFLVFDLSAKAQVTLIPTGTTSQLTPLSIISKNILVHGIRNFSAKSYDECNTMTAMPVPGSSTDWNYLQRLDTNYSFTMISDMLNNSTTIYRTEDSGKSWQLKLDTQNYFATHHAYFDSLEGVAVSNFQKLIRTKDGGKTWQIGSQPHGVMSAIKPHSDSLLMVGGGTGDFGAFCLSKDRGHTWNLCGHFANVTAGNPQPIDFFFLNRDTIFGIATAGFIGVPLAKSTNGGNSWQYQIISTSNFTPSSIIAKSKNEIYVVGIDTSKKGVILRSTNFGNTWQSFNCGISCQLLDLEFINDSIALVSGTEGILFKLNVRKALFTVIPTGLTEYNSTLLAKISPNPAKDFVKIGLNEAPGKSIDITVYDVMGKSLQTEKFTGAPAELKVSSLPSGIYFLRIETGVKTATLKMVKE